MPTMLFVVNVWNEAAAACAHDTAQRLRSQGHQIIAPDLDESLEYSSDSLDATSAAEALRNGGIDLAISFGGDGSILRTVQLLNGADVEILGVNFGLRGYLTSVEPTEVEQAVQRTLRGDRMIETRTLVAGSFQGETFHALNDIVVERAHGETTITLQAKIDGKPFTSFPADGMIVATPTGSTAYALSAGGPIVWPLATGLQLTPVSPHILFDRTLVLAPDVVIDLTLRGERSAVVSVDGRTMAAMSSGDTIQCQRSSRVARLVTFGERNHFEILTSKLGISDKSTETG